MRRRDFLPTTLARVATDCIDRAAVSLPVEPRCERNPTRQPTGFLGEQGENFLGNILRGVRVAVQQAHRRSMNQSEVHGDQGPECLLASRGGVLGEGLGGIVGWLRILHLVLTNRHHSLVQTDNFLCRPIRRSISPSAASPWTLSFQLNFLDWTSYSLVVGDEPTRGRRPRATGPPQNEKAAQSPARLLG